MKMTAWIVAVLLAGSSALFGQSGEIEVHGHIREVATGKGIVAKVSYKSLPTGSINGSFHDSTYRFTIFGSSKYQLSVAAANYIPKVITIDPSRYAGKGGIDKDIILTPNNQSIRLSHLLFEQSKATIDPSSFEELDEIAAMLIETPDIIIQLEGHTDNTGNAQANMKLSQERVEAVKRYLIGKKVNKNQVKTKAFGGTQPVAKGNTPEERELNRRVEMRVLSGKQ